MEGIQYFGSNGKKETARTDKKFISVYFVDDAYDIRGKMFDGTLDKVIIK